MKWDLTLIGGNKDEFDEKQPRGEKKPRWGSKYKAVQKSGSRFAFNATFFIKSKLTLTLSSVHHIFPLWDTNPLSQYFITRTLSHALSSPALHAPPIGPQAHIIIPFSLVPKPGVSPQNAATSTSEAEAAAAAAAATHSFNIIML